MKQTINRILESLVSLAGGSQSTAVGIAITAFLSNFFLPIIPVVLTCFGLSLVDLFYGLKVAKLQKTKLESRRTWNGTLKKMRDTITIIAGARGIELFILPLFITVPVLTGGVALIVALTEFWSILENLHTIDPNGPWRALGKFMRQKGSDVINVDLDKILKDDNTDKEVSS